MFLSAIGRMVEHLEHEHAHENACLRVPFRISLLLQNQISTDRSLFRGSEILLPLGLLFLRASPTLTMKEGSKRDPTAFRSSTVSSRLSSRNASARALLARSLIGITWRWRWDWN
jgi:hypothetical protein